MSHLTQNMSFPSYSSQPKFWIGTEKLNLTQQKQACIRNKTQYKINEPHTGLMVDSYLLPTSKSRDTKNSKK